MAELFDKTGRAVQVPDDQVIAALQSGQYGLPRGQGVPMVAPDGTVYEMSMDDALAAATEEGATFEGTGARRGRELQEEYGATLGQEITAGLAGAARGLTFGLSDQALVGLGVKPEDLSGLREANPWASTGSELAAIAGSLFIPGGQGRALGLLGRTAEGGSVTAKALTGAGKGLRVAGYAPRQVARLGLGVEKAVGAKLAPLAAKGALGRVAARGLEMGAGSAVEGTLYGGGIAVSEMALGDIEGTAENLVALIGMGTLLGGGFGAVLGGGFKGVGALYTAAKPARLTRETAEEVAKIWERTTGNKVLPGVVDEIMKNKVKFKGTVEEMADLWDAELKRLGGEPSLAGEALETVGGVYAKLAETVGAATRGVVSSKARAEVLGLGRKFVEGLIGLEVKSVQYTGRVLRELVKTVKKTRVEMRARGKVGIEAAEEALENETLLGAAYYDAAAKSPRVTGKPARAAVEATEAEVKASGKEVKNLQENLTELSAGAKKELAEIEARLKVKFDAIDHEADQVKEALKKATTVEEQDGILARMEELVTKRETVADDLMKLMDKQTREAAKRLGLGRAGVKIRGVSEEVVAFWEEAVKDPQLMDAALEIAKRSGETMGEVIEGLGRDKVVITAVMEKTLQAARLVARAKGVPASVVKKVARQLGEVVSTVDDRFETYLENAAMRTAKRAVARKIGPSPKVAAARDQASRELAVLWDEGEKGFEAALDGATKGRKDIYRAVIQETKVDKKQILGSARRAAADLLGGGAPGGAGVLSQLDDIVKAEGGGFPQFMQDIQKSALETRRKIKAAVGTRDEIALIAENLDDFKRDLVKNIRRMASKPDPSSTELRTLATSLRILDKVSNPLEDAMIFGETMATIQSRTRRATGDYLGAVTTGERFRFMQAWETPDWAPKISAAPKKIRQYLDDISDGIDYTDPRAAGFMRDKLNTDALRKEMRARQDFIVTIATTPGLPADTVKKLAKFKIAYRKFDSLLDDLEKTAGVKNQARAIEEGLKGIGTPTDRRLMKEMLVEGAMGAALGYGIQDEDLTHAAIGGALGAVFTPYNLMAKLGLISRKASGMTERIAAAIDNYAGRFRPASAIEAARRHVARGAAELAPLAAPGKVVRKPWPRAKLRRIIAPAATGILQRTSFSGEKRKVNNNKQAFKHRIQELQAIVHSPAYATERLKKSTEAVAIVAPQLAGYLQEKAIKTANFLLSKAPKDPGLPSPFKPDWEPSSFEILKWERYVLGATEPMSVINDLRNGTLSHESVEALQETSPKIYQQIVTKLAGHMDMLRGSLPYAERIQLSILFGVPLEATLQPSFIASMQAAQLNKLQPTAPPPGLPRQRSTKQGTAEQTQAQRLTAG